MPKKRITMKLNNPNPLFERWLIEWRDTAIEKNSKMQYCYSKALNSLQKYPLVLASGRDCIILDGFGEKLCQMIDEKLTKYKKLNPFKLSSTTQSVDADCPNNVQRLLLSQKEYVPIIRSGPWAVLITLYKKSLEPQHVRFLLKSEIIKNAQCLCDKSFVKPEPGSYYTTWSSVKILLDKKLVIKVDKPAKYSLTDEGVLLAHKLYKNLLNNNANIDAPSDIPNFTESSKAAPKGRKATLKRNKATSKCKLKAPVSSEGSSSSLTSESACQEFTNISESRSTSSLIQEESFICVPHTFDIVFIVDKMEVSGNRHPLDDITLAELTNLNVIYEVRHLKVGDYTWICREHSTNRELILPYVVERKRMDDFGHSIRDGRFHEQKFRLKQCGIQNVIYLIESFGNNTHTSLPLANLEQAAINTLIHDGFSVKFTEDTKATVKYFAALTNILKSIYLSKTLISCPKSNLSQAINEEDLASLMSFHEFNIEATKNKNLKVQDMFVRMLLQLRGISVDKALTIVEKYSTPQLLMLTYSENSSLLNEKLLANLEYGKLKKKIGPVISKTIYQLFAKTNY